ncbi:biopolymer transport protein ExbD [Faecalicoccus acidiformans]|uniref:Biopolymer transport protein ExbD n=1 Tax=Faecalicoccus acidiformans TaxID=915173 RepID=A0A7W8CZH2_9FIRM|nr:hypothetical protein [Faecalicoccus acidiformans]MBB5184470.1 biopolymer transport protein ExbD [Faecalicoccus acidiformans]
MAEKLSRTKRYQELRNRLDEETTAAQEDKINQQTGFARLSRTQHKALSHASDHHAATSTFTYEDAPKQSPVMEDLLGEVKQYNIEKGNRYTDDTQINILHQLDSRSGITRRNTHILPVDEEESGTTMRMSKPAMDVDGVATYMPNQKLTRINPVMTKPETVSVPEVEQERAEEDSITLSHDENKSVFLGNNDFLVDDTIDTDHLSLFDTKPSTQAEVKEADQEPVQSKRVKKSSKSKKSEKRKTVSPDMPSAKIRMSTRDIEDMEKEPKSRSGMIVNVILVVLVILLLASIAATLYFLTQIGA